jgi:hypothetical protein
LRTKKIAGKLASRRVFGGSPGLVDNSTKENLDGRSLVHPRQAILLGAPQISL